jgi:predicted xylose isomerase-like sugar epimerase
MHREYVPVQRSRIGRAGGGRPNVLMRCARMQAKEKAEEVRQRELAEAVQRMEEQKQLAQLINPGFTVLGVRQVSAAAAASASASAVPVAGPPPTDSTNASCGAWRGRS